MQRLSAFLFFLVLAVAEAAPDTLEMARQLAGSGATRLALNHVEKMQPRDPVAPRWAEWELLRLNLLARLDLHAQLLERVRLLPPDLPAEQRREALMLEARAALAAQQGAAARQAGARLLWQFSASGEAAREIRLLVIESYLAEGKGEEAFRSMLRFDQDHRPLERATATRFAEGLLELGLAREAVNWLAGLDDAGPAKLLLRFKAGLSPADAVIAQAQAAVAKNNDPGFWRVLLEAAQHVGNRLLYIEALENILGVDEPRKQKTLPTWVRDLWQAYLGTAADTGNKHHLLAGDDDAWTEFASRNLAASPVLSRALHAHLAQRGRTEEARHHAQLQLINSLQARRLELAALRLYSDAATDGKTLGAGARHHLGAIAERRNLAPLALRFWQGVSAPANTDAEEWQLRVAGVALRAGDPDAAAAAIEQAVSRMRKASPEFVRRGVIAAQEILDGGRFDLADSLFGVLLPISDGMQRRSILMALGRIGEATGRSVAAADYYLRSALLAESKAPDALALQARLAAALNLARAGYRDDARSQFEWLAANSRDSGQLEIARRELKKPDAQPK